MNAPLPAGAAPFIGFASLLRANGFPVSPDQTGDFIAGIGCLGPRGIEDVRSAALSLFAIQPEAREVFDELFAAHFLGTTLIPPAQARMARKPPPMMAPARPSPKSARMRKRRARRQQPPKGSPRVIWPWARMRRCCISRDMRGQDCQGGSAIAIGPPEKARNRIFAAPFAPPRAGMVRLWCCPAGRGRADKGGCCC